MFDHVTIRVSDLEEARRFYVAALGEPSWEDGELIEWRDFSVMPGAATRNAHVAFAASSPEEVDAFWRAGTDAGFRDNGPPGPRPQYRPGYYGAFVLDPDGNNIEAVHHEGVGAGGAIQHVWLRVRDLEASRRFYETIAPMTGIELWEANASRVSFRGSEGSCSFVPGEPSQNVHLAFPAPDNATVDEFHRVALAAGYRDNGRPGERDYHAGYYGAFVLDPDGNNVEAVCHNRD